MIWIFFKLNVLLIHLSDSKAKQDKVKVTDLNKIAKNSLFFNFAKILT